MALGTVHEETKDYQTETKSPDLSLNVAEEKETGNSWWYSIFAVVTVFLILLILALIGSLRRKSRLLKEAGPMKKAGWSFWFFLQRQR